MKTRYHLIAVRARSESGQQRLLNWLLITLVILALVAALNEAGARGGRGGGGAGFSRSGPAASGSFSGGRGGSRPAERPAYGGGRQEIQDGRTGSREDWQQHREEIQDDRQQHASSSREDRQDFYEDEVDGGWDNDWDGDNVGEAIVAGAIIRRAATVASTPVYHYYSTPPCTPTIVLVHGTTYYQCKSDWYTQTYAESGGVVYVLVTPPAGY